MAYVTLTVYVEGALESVEDIHDDVALRDRRDKLEADAAADGYPTEVYELYHDHAYDGEDCGCAECLLDTRPTQIYN